MDTASPTDTADFGYALEAEARPWGRFDVLQKGPRYKVKTLMVLPGMRTSLQSHRYRREVWTVVSGTGLLSICGAEYHALEGQTFHVGYGVAHRIANPSRMPLILIETQVGTYCEEDDITRYDDDHDRKLSSRAESAPYSGIGTTLASHIP